MVAMTSNKPYFIRAIYDWVVDNELTPYLLVNAEHPDAEVPQEFVSNGRIVLNISPDACRGLHLENDRIVFTARFSGQVTQVVLSPSAVLAIYAKENGRGMEFGDDDDEGMSMEEAPPKATSRRKPVLKLVKQEKQ